MRMHASNISTALENTEFAGNTAKGSAFQGKPGTDSDFRQTAPEIHVSPRFAAQTNGTDANSNSHYGSHGTGWGRPVPTPSLSSFTNGRFTRRGSRDARACLL